MAKPHHYNAYVNNPVQLEGYEIFARCDEETYTTCTIQIQNIETTTETHDNMSTYTTDETSTK